MSLKSTKGIQRLNTKILSKSIGPVAGTEKVSLASKNITNWAQEVGLESEQRVEDYFLSFDFSCVARRLRTPFAEIDLIFEKGGALYIVEVKALSNIDFGPVRVRTGQRRRLMRARDDLQARRGVDVVLAFAYVLRSGQILLFSETGDGISLGDEA